MRTPHPSKHLRLLASELRIIRNAERRITFHVARARSAGASWAEIGTALNISKQAAQQRFSEYDLAAMAEAYPTPTDITEGEQPSSHDRQPVLSESTDRRNP